MALVYHDYQRYADGIIIVQCVKMSDQSRHNVFHLAEDDGDVGYFLTDEFPSAAGIYRYMPFRSPSHYRMHQLLRERRTVTCWYCAGRG